MGISYFQKGAMIQIGYNQHVMRREISEGNWQTEEIRTGRLHEFSMQELERLYASGELVFFDENKKVNQTVNIDASKIIAVPPQPSESLWDKAKIRRVYAKSIEHLPSTRKVVEEVIRELWEKTGLPATPPNWVSVVRWKNRYISNGNNAHALVEKHKAKGNREPRYPKGVHHIVDDVIERIYLTRERNSIETTLEHAIVAVHQENQLLPASMHLPRPTRRLIKSVIDKLSAYDRHAARYGKTNAIRRFRAKLKHAITDHRLEVAEIDHTKLDLFVLSDDGLMPLGRPWVTVCIDNHTRCILGIYIGFEPPSFLSVARCLKHAFLPKSFLKEDYPDIKNEWDAYGVMQTLVVDNGLEFHGNSIEQSCYAFGINILYTPRKSPWFKGKVERFIRTMNENISYGTPGTTFSNIFEKDDYNPAEHAIVSISTLQLIVHKWVADYYHQKPHCGLDFVSPSTMWKSSRSAIGSPVADNPAEIDVLLGKPHTAVLSHVGIKINRLLYNSPELNNLRRQYGDKLEVDIRIDESNVGHIHVMLPDQSGYVEVHALNHEYAEGVSLWLHNVYRNFAVNNLEKDDPVNWAMAKVEIANIIKREMQGKPRKTNSKLARYQEASKPRTRKPASTPVAPISNAMPVLTMDIVKTASTGIRPKFTAVIENRGKQPI